jgi:hypothetical protein
LTGVWVVRAGSYDLPFVVFTACLLTAAVLLVFAPYPSRPGREPAAVR